MADTYADGAPPAAEAVDGKSTKAKAADATALLQRYWREIARYDRAASDWRLQGEKIVKIYLDQHRTPTSKTRRFALLWSNVETLKPAVYAKTPSVVVSRRWRDPDPVGRVASEVLERAVNCTFDLKHIDGVLRMVRDDRLLPGRGQGWVRYEADIETVEGGQPSPPAAAMPGVNGAPAPAAQTPTAYEKLRYECVVVDHVHWCDFGHSVARTWMDVWLVWRRVYMDRDAAEERFGEEIAKKLVYTAKAPEDKDADGINKAVVYELWDKKRRRTVFISKDCPHILEDEPPPLNFRDFFPCPEPCLGTRTSTSLIPTPDYKYYQDQAEEIDDLTGKIGELTDWLLVKGFVPGGPSSEGAEAIERLVRDLQGKQVLVQIESWAGFTEKGGATKLIDWLPIDIIVQALREAVVTRAQLVQDVFQITGISDILRGQSDPDETLGAQQIKTQTGSRRVRNTKDEVARFARDLGMLVAEVIAEQFQPQTIAEMTGFKYVPGPALPAAALPAPAMGMMPNGGPPAPMVPGAPPMPTAMPPAAENPAGKPTNLTFGDDVMQLLRNDRMRGFVLDIETDSTVQPDEDAEKQRRNEFLTAVGGFMQQSIEALTAAPEIAPAVGEMLMFTVRGYRAGRGLEEVIERSVQALAQKLTQPVQQQPSPEQIKAQADAAAAEQKMQADQQKMLADQQRMQDEAAARQMELQHKRHMAELQFKQAEAEHLARLEMMQTEARMKEAEHARKMEALDGELALKQEEAQIAREQAEEKHARDLEAKREDRETVRAKRAGDGAAAGGPPG